MADISLSLVSHTNVGKTTLARTLLARDIGEVRDAPHVTEFAEHHELIATAAAPVAPAADGSAGGEIDRLLLWDTPGFGDSVRLAARMRQQGNPIGWFLSAVWDRWRDRAFWADQQVLRHVRDASDVVLYLVSAAEPDAAWLAPEMELLQWAGKPVVVLLNQLGEPRDAATERAELQRWRERLARWPLVRAVLPLDAFARCWVHERTLLDAVRSTLPPPAAAAMHRLTAAWQRRQQERFDASMRVLAASLADLGCAREPIEPTGDLGERLRRIGQRLGGTGGDAEALAGQRLQARLQAQLRGSTAELLALHGIEGRPGDDAVEQILERVAAQFDPHRKISEGRAALVGGALTGALAGLKADLATGGLTLGGGLLAGGILGALSAAGVARGLNRLRGTDRGWLAFSDEALGAALHAALLRYLAVAHFGRGRGGWVQGEAPAHWPQAVAKAIAPGDEAFAAVWRSLAGRAELEATEPPRVAAALAPELAAATRRVLARLYPGPDNRAP